MGNTLSKIPSLSPPGNTFRDGIRRRSGRELGKRPLVLVNGEAGHDLGIDAIEEVGNSAIEAHTNNPIPHGPTVHGSTRHDIAARRARIYSYKP